MSLPHLFYIGNQLGLIKQGLVDMIMFRGLFNLGLFDFYHFRKGTIQSVSHIRLVRRTPKFLMVLWTVQIGVHFRIVYKTNSVNRLWMVLETILERHVLHQLSKGALEIAWRLADTDPVGHVRAQHHDGIHDSCSPRWIQHVVGVIVLPIHIAPYGCLERIFIGHAPNATYPCTAGPTFLGHWYTITHHLL